MGLSYEASKKVAYKIITILGVITLAEVIFALLAKGYLIDGFHLPWYITSIVMVVMSIVKAYLIVYEFMHMKYEVPGLVKTVLLPTMLLVWAVIAFFMEGSYWQNQRGHVLDKNKEDRVSVEMPKKMDSQTKKMGH